MQTEDNLKFLGQVNKNKRLNENKITRSDLWVLIFKMHSPISIVSKMLFENSDGTTPRHLDNLFNPNMNNVTALDHASLDHVCADGVIARYL